MSDLTTAEEAIETVLAMAMPGPWEADGDPWNRIIWSSAENRVCFMAHSNGLDDARDIATSNLVAAAPDLARTVIALHAQLADAQAAMALVVERAVAICESHRDKSGADIAHHNAAQGLADAIRALAPIDGLALVRELREEIASSNKLLTDEARASLDRLERAETAEAERDRLAAANVALEAKVAGLREAVDEQTKARAQHWLRRTMTAPEDAEVEALCERCGYGAVMDAASRLWARKPHGSGAFYIGGCIGFKSDEEARAALATQEAGTC